MAFQHPWRQPHVADTSRTGMWCCRINPLRESNASVKRLIVCLTCSVPRKTAGHPARQGLCPLSAMKRLLPDLPTSPTTHILPLLSLEWIGSSQTTQLNHCRCMNANAHCSCNGAAHRARRKSHADQHLHEVCIWS